MNTSFDAGRSFRPAQPGGTFAHTREPIPPFSDFVEVRCEDCDGTGYDFGSHKEFDPEYCSRCGGSGTALVFRNYLAEAFRIVSDPNCKVDLCREQIVALATYARQTVSALFAGEPMGTDGNYGGGVRW